MWTLKGEMNTSIKGKESEGEGGTPGGRRIKILQKGRRGRILGSSDEIRGPKSYNPYQWNA